MAVAMLTLAPACRRSGEDKEIKELAQKAAELDKLNQQANTAGTEQSSKLKRGRGQRCPAQHRHHAAHR